MRPGLTISIAAHAVALGLSLVALSAQPMDSPKVDALPVSFISDKDLDQLTKGVKNAPKPEIKEPKPLADKIDVPKPVEQTADKVGKQEIKTETAGAKQQSKPDPKPPEKAQTKPPPDYKPDQIAQLLKKDADKQPPKPDPKQAPDKPQKDAPKFNADQVAALLDHREPQRQVATAEAINPTASLGAAKGTAAEMSQDEVEAFRARLMSCYSLPPTIPDDPKLRVVLDVAFKRDGTLARDPEVDVGTPSAVGPVLVAAGMKALQACQPFTMLKPEHYNQWKRLPLEFTAHTDH